MLPGPGHASVYNCKQGAGYNWPVRKAQRLRWACKRCHDWTHGCHDRNTFWGGCSILGMLEATEKTFFGIMS